MHELKIIRHGLWYKTVSHGRAFGNGISKRLRCYLERAKVTSPVCCEDTAKRETRSVDRFLGTIRGSREEECAERLQLEL